MKPTRLIGNPLYEIWKKHHPVPPPRTMRDHLLAGLPNPIEFRATFEARIEATSAYAYGIPTTPILEVIAKFSPIVEIGAGRGYWAALLTKLKADVVAYDIIPPGNEPDQPGNAYFQQGPLFFDVQHGGPEKVQIHRNRALFLCWPPYNTTMATECLQRYKGKTVLYVGEWKACTANEEFHDILERDYHSLNIDHPHLPQWFGIHDELFIYQRK